MDPGKSINALTSLHGRRDHGDWYEACSKTYKGPFKYVAVNLDKIGT